MFHYGKALHDSATRQSITSSPGLFQTPSLVAVELVPPGNGLHMVGNVISWWHHVLLAATAASKDAARRQ